MNEYEYNNMEYYAEEPPPKKPFFGLGCCGCLVASAVAVVLMVILLIGGAYWFFNTQILQKQPYPLVAEYLYDDDVEVLEQKIQKIYEPTPQDSVVTLSEAEVNYFILKKIEELEIEDPESIEAIENVGVILEGDEGEGRISLRLGEKYLNVRLRSQFKIEDDNLTIDKLEFQVGKHRIAQLEEEMMGRIKEEYNSTTQNPETNEAMENIKSITIKDGEVVLRLKENEHLNLNSNPNLNRK